MYSELSEMCGYQFTSGWCTALLPTDKIKIQAVLSKKQFFRKSKDHKIQEIKQIYIIIKSSIPEICIQQLYIYILGALICRSFCEFPSKEGTRKLSYSQLCLLIINHLCYEPKFQTKSSLANSIMNQNTNKMEFSHEKYLDVENSSLHPKWITLLDCTELVGWDTQNSWDGIRNTLVKCTVCPTVTKNDIQRMGGWRVGLKIIDHCTKPDYR